MEVPAGLNSGARSTLPMDESESPLRIGWERCLDLESGLFYFKNWETGTRSYVPPLGDGKFCTLTAAECLQLGELAVASDRTTTPFKELELFPLSSNSASLARDGPRQRQVRSRDLFKSKCTSPRSSSSSSSASSVNFRGDGVEKDRAKVRDSRKRKRLVEDDMRLENPREWSRAMVLAGCPRCLMYVMFCKSNRRCPNCGHVFLGHQGIISFEP